MHAFYWSVTVCVFFFSSVRRHLSIFLKEHHLFNDAYRYSKEMLTQTIFINTYICTRLHVNFRETSIACIFYNVRVVSYIKKSENCIIFTVTFFIPSKSCQSLKSYGLHVVRNHIQATWHSKRHRLIGPNFFNVTVTTSEDWMEESTFKIEVHFIYMFG